MTNEEAHKIFKEYVAKLLTIPCMGCGKTFKQLEEQKGPPHCQKCCFYGRIGSKCEGCGSEISKTWMFRPYGHRCIKCGWMHIESYGKSWAVEDEEERNALIELQDKLTDPENVKRLPYYCPQCKTNGKWKFDDKNDSATCTNCGCVAKWKYPEELLEDEKNKRNDDNNNHYYQNPTR